MKKQKETYNFYAVGVRCAEKYPDEFEVRYYSYNKHYGSNAAYRFLLGFRSVFPSHTLFEEIDKLTGDGINTKATIDGSIYIDTMPDVKENVWGK